MSRADLRAALKTLLDSVVSSGELKKAWDTTPPDFGNSFPCAYIENVSETILWDSGTRRRTAGPSIVVIDVLSENNVTAKRVDAAVDALVEAESPQLDDWVDRGSWSIEDFDRADTANSYVGSRISIATIDLQEARP